MADPTSSQSTGSEQSVSAPAGTGNASGFGEAFGLNLNTGQASYKVPVPLPKGVAGQPVSVDLVYAQSAGNGPFGLGWAVPMRTVELRLDFGVPGEAVHEAAGTDTLSARYLADGVEVVEVSPGRWRARAESAFDRFERSGDQPADGWTVRQRDGAVLELGHDPANRVADPHHPERVVQWLPERQVDVQGNAITYAWEVDGGTPYLSAVSWASYTLRLDYADRPDVLRNGRAGWLRLTTRRCTALRLQVDDGGPRDVRRWDLTYRQAPLSGVSLLASVRLSSLGPGTDGTGDVVRPAQTFDYTEPDPTGWHARFVDADRLTPPPALTGPDARLTPLDSGPLPGVLAGLGRSIWYWGQDADGDFGTPHRVTGLPLDAVGVRDSRLQVADLDGDGAVDLLVGVGAALPRGYAAGAGPDGWDRYVAYPRTATTPDLDATTRFADLDGDGRVDALGQLGRTIIWWRNRGTSGWSSPVPVRVATVPPGDPAAGLVDPPDLADPSVLLGDMTGDGLPDLVRVRSGQVVYWPNLGLGRFGAPVLMTGSPRVRTGDSTQVLLADVDGDGCADLVLVGPGGVEVVPNRSGAGWGAPVVDPLVPAPLPGTAAPVPGAGGRGEALQWCAPRGPVGSPSYVRYDPTVGAGYLLRGTDNGIGLTATVEHGPAAAQADRDRRDGTPWPDAVPFPVSVVTATTVTEAVSGQVTRTEYRYHDGFFDERERQFCGFARVERDELGDASRPTYRTVHHFLVGQDRLPGHGREHVHLNRLLARVEHLELDGSPEQAQPVLVEDSDYSVQALPGPAGGPSRAWVRVERTARRWRDRSADPATADERVEQRTLTYDDATGDVVGEDLSHRGTQGGSPAADIVVRTTLQHAVHPTGLVLGRPASILRRDGAGSLIGEVRRFYDGPDYQGLPAGQVERGLLTRELRWAMTVADARARYGDALDPDVADVGALGYLVLPDADGADALFAVAVQRAHDGAGRLVGERSTPGQTTTYAYDPSGLHRTTSTRPHGVTTVVTDVATGQPVEVTDPDGTHVSMRYDAQGRLTSVVLPGDTAALPSRTYSYTDGTPGVVMVRRRLRHGEVATADGAIVFDGMGREQQRREVLEPGRVIVSGHVVRSPFGDAAAEYEPTFEGDLTWHPVTPAELAGRTSRRFGYDAQGRPVRTVDHDGAVSTTRFQAFAITSVDALGVRRTDRVDAANHRVAVVEANTDGPVTTRFTPDANGHLEVHADDAGEVARFAYDGLGNRVQTDHRDAGRWVTLHDAQGRAVQVIDPDGRVATAEYDGLGRILTFAVDGVVRETYTYDDVASHGLGRLHTAAYPGGRQTFGYDAQGRIASRRYEVNGHGAAYELQFERDAVGRLVRQVQPDGSDVRYERYDNGLVRAVPGTIDAIDYEPRKLATSVVHANGVVRTTTYTSGTGRVASQRTVGPDGTVLEDVAYGFDALGQCTSLDESTPGAAGHVTYGYDPLRQLVGTTDSRPGGADATFGYQQRTLLSQGEDGAVLALGDADHPTRPDALTVGAAGPVALIYDAAGRLTSLPGRTLRWDAKGQLAGVDRPGGTSADYDYI